MDVPCDGATSDTLQPPPKKTMTVALFSHYDRKRYGSGRLKDQKLLLFLFNSKINKWPTIQQPAALAQFPQVVQDQAGNDVIRYQLTLIDAGLHQQTQFCRDKKRNI